MPKLVIIVLMGLAGCSDESNVTGSGPPHTVTVWKTRGDQSFLLTQDPTALSFEAPTFSTEASVEVRASTTYQPMLGYGAALTGSSAYVLKEDMTDKQRHNLLVDLFSTQEGIGIEALRLTMGASDFSLESYTYDDVPSGTTDSNLEQFSIAHDREYVIPVLKEILTINPDVTLIASPWSAPAWMKTPPSWGGERQLAGGSLRQEAYPALADYFVKYVQAYQSEGISIWGITVQNEPLHAASYPTMRMSAPEQVDFIQNHLKPAFAENHLSTKIIAYDHNWDTVTYPLKVLREAGDAVYGAAFHCYAGDVSAMSRVHDAYPEEAVLFTECSGGNWATNFADNIDYFGRNLVIGAPNNWARAVLLWNLALDENHGPTNDTHYGGGGPAQNGCKNCRGVVTVHSASGKVTRNEEYYVLAHVSQFVRNGAHRIASEVSGNDQIQATAFLNPDGSRVVVLLNPTDEVASVAVQEGEKAFRYGLGGNALATFVWSRH